MLCFEQPDDRISGREAIEKYEELKYNKKEGKVH
jgi:hypothetical protein